MHASASTTCCALLQEGQGRGAARRAGLRAGGGQGRGVCAVCWVAARRYRAVELGCYPVKPGSRAVEEAVGPPLGRGCTLGVLEDWGPGAARLSAQRGPSLMPAHGLQRKTRSGASCGSCSSHRSASWRGGLRTVRSRAWWEAVG
jgi:hypothetical protein